MKKGISVIVCCYNSLLRLPETLKHLVFQQVDSSIPWEVILVNNASTDNTKESAVVEWEKYKSNINFVVIDELRPGIIHARRSGIDAAKYDYIVFCDDDNWLKNDYLQTAYNIMEENKSIGALGGQSEIVTDAVLPDWWDQEKNSYAVGKQAEKSSNVSKRGYLWGAGLVVRKEILMKVFDSRYPFLTTGRKEHAILSGDDFEICSRILLLKWELFYADNLFFKHNISRERLTEEYKAKLNLSFDAILKIHDKYKFAIEFSNYSPIEKITQLLKKIISLPKSGFNERKIMLFGVFVLFAMGLKIINDEDIQIIYNFIKKK